MTAELWRIMFRTPMGFSLRKLSCLLSQDLSTCRCSSLRLFKGRVISTSSIIEKKETKLECNPFYEKYYEKIKIVNDSLKEREKNNQKLEKKMQFEPRTSKEVDIPKMEKNRVPDHQKEKTLNSMMNMDYIEDLSANEIAQIWKSYHQKKCCISACIPSNIYQRIQKKAEKFPLFIYPLPKDGGYQFMFAQFSGSVCYVTTLLQYQTLGESAPWVLAIKHFTELSESKGIVLMVGESNTNHLSVIDAQWLGYQIQMYYASNSTAKDDLLRIFNNEPDKFDYMSVIKMLQNEIVSGAVNTDIIKQQINDN